jgi:hypothetical protein
MLRPRWRRVLAALTGVWVLVILTSPVALWSCPAHGDAHGTMGAMPHDMSHMAGQAHEHGPAQSGHQHSNQCTCPGCCCGVAAVGLAPGRLVSLPVIPVAIVAQTPAPALGAPRDVTTHLRLPLPLGPPAIRV